jgi:3-dehydroquinate dehydratase-2
MWVRKFCKGGTMKKVLVLHGINLNMFGKRDPSQYGSMTLPEIDDEIRALAPELGLDVECFQTNHEGEMAQRIHEAHGDGTDAVLINAGAWTHYSYGIADALAILEIPVVEVHMSHVHGREEFRHRSVFSSVVKGVVSGFGVSSYLLGLRAAAGLIKDRN